MMKTIIKKYKILILLLLLTFSLRMLLFIIFQPWKADMENKVVLLYDAVGYQKLALSILYFFHIKTEIIRTPIYPAFIAGVYAVFGIKPYLVLFFQILLSTFTAYFFYKIVALLSNQKIAYFALFIFAIEPTLILYTSFLYSEILFMFFTMMSLWLLIIGLKTKSMLHFILSSIALGLATLTRPAGQFLILVHILLILFYNKKCIKSIKYAIVILIVYLLSISPWALRNYKYYDRLKLSSTMEHNALILSSFYTAFKSSPLPKDTIINQFLVRVKEMSPPHLAKNSPKNMTELMLTNPTFERTEVYAKVAKEYLLAHKKAFLLAQIKGAINLHLNMGTEQYMLRLHQETKRWDIRDKVSLGLFDAAYKFFQTKTLTEIMLGVFILFILALVYLFSLFGVYYLIKSKQYYVLLFCFLNIGYYVALSSIYPTPRFRNPFMPFYILLASIGFYHFINRKVPTT
jgi:4-amino-4-deoxy-L-arabinose transferase-like glycosyltransferase